MYRSAQATNMLSASEFRCIAPFTVAVSPFSRADDATREPDEIPISAVKSNQTQTTPGVRYSSKRAVLARVLLAPVTRPTACGSISRPPSRAITRLSATGLDNEAGPHSHNDHNDDHASAHRSANWHTSISPGHPAACFGHRQRAGAVVVNDCHSWQSTRSSF